jgi:hypothetical protein
LNFFLKISELIKFNIKLEVLNTFKEVKEEKEYSNLFNFPGRKFISLFEEQRLIYKTLKTVKMKLIFKITKE